MNVVEGWISGIEFKKVPLEKPLNKVVLKHLCDGIAINSKAYISNPGPGKPIEYIGNKTECALLVFIGKLGADYNKIREKYEVLRLFAFSSARKRMSAIVRKDAQSAAQSDSPYIMYIKVCYIFALHKSTSSSNSQINRFRVLLK